MTREDSKAIAIGTFIGLLVALFFVLVFSNAAWSWPCSERPNEAHCTTTTLPPTTLPPAPTTTTAEAPTTTTAPQAPATTVPVRTVPSSAFSPASAVPYGGGDAAPALSELPKTGPDDSTTSGLLGIGAGLLFLGLTIVVLEKRKARR